MRIVVAIGGNALIAAGETGTWDEQRRRARAIAEELVALRNAGHELVVTHGNGPQAGALMMQQDLGADAYPPLPIDAVVAMTQGQIGYLLESAIAAVDGDVPTAVLLTRVIVDPDDPAFETPTKPVGAFYSAGEARRLAEDHGWDVAPDAGRGWRRVVASPHPKEVMGRANVRALLERGTLVIAAGGGGIPVVAGARGIDGVPGIIDKDRCSAELALATGAELLVLLTGVERVALDFGTRWERELARITVSDAVRGLTDGEFPAGSMGPKLEAAGRFVAAGGGRAVITSAGRLLAAVDGRSGTVVVLDSDGPSVVAESGVWA
jgi:carbamate kinase